jgi:hypothetical protein
MDRGFNEGAWSQMAVATASDRPPGGPDPLQGVS